jgi:hypothetical protein
MRISWLSLLLVLCVGLAWGCKKRRKKSAKSTPAQAASTEQNDDSPAGSEFFDLKSEARAKTKEAIDQLDKIYKASSYYYSAPRVARTTGMKLPCQFPASQGMTPDVSGRKCCKGALDKDQDNRCDVDTRKWTTATWSALNFQMNDQHYFGYAYTSSGTGATAKFTASAHADLDCDGVLSTFERYGYGDASATCSMRGSPAFYKNNETE